MEQIPWNPPSFLDWRQEQADRENAHPGSDKRQRPEHDDFTLGSSERAPRVSGEFVTALMYDSGRTYKDGKASVLIDEDADPTLEAVLESIEPGEDVLPLPVDLPTLAELLPHLTPKQRFVFERRYGLIDGIRYTQDEIAASMGVSRQAVGKIEDEALEKLRGSRGRVCAVCGGSMESKRADAKTCSQKCRKALARHT